MPTVAPTKPPPAKRARRPRIWHWLVIGLVVLGSAVAAGVLGAYQVRYQGRIYPGVVVAGQPAGGMTPAALLELLTARRDAVLRQGLVLDVDGKQVPLPLEITASDPDLARVTITYNVAAAVADAYRVGRGGTPWSQLVEPIRLRWIGRSLPVPFTVDNLAFNELLRSVLGPEELPPRPARLALTATSTLALLPEQAGRVADAATVTAKIKAHLGAFDATTIPVRLVTVPPPITAAETSDAFRQAVALANTTPPAVTYQDREWPVPAQTFLGWLEFQRAEASDGAGTVRLGINADAVTRWLTPIVADINVTPRDAKFRLENGRVVEFQASRDGLEVDVASTTQALVTEFIQRGNPRISLAVRARPATVATSDVNDLGIRELLGVGRSNFKGSPKNRRHNIQIGVNALNGLLIAPNEEFSLLKALGKVDASTGYLPELVIKGDRTIPEFGGGLCQIGTTTFRAAIKSGLPITKRQNHSFRVRYYDPPGMDATIYDPAPDFRFKNDTGRHILFVAEVQGDELVFSFYGTKDGRQVAVPDKATILSTTSSGPVRYIVTDELKPGEKKLVERPAPGGSTVFQYQVTYPDGRVNAQEFKSVYRPWPETWLVGATTTPETAPAEGSAGP